MKLRALILDENARAEVARLRGYAESNRVSLDDLQRCQEHPELAVGNNPSHVIIIPQGYRVVFSVEEQPAGLAEHLSVSVLPHQPDVWPSVESVVQIALEFGWPKLPLGTGGKLPFGVHVWTEADPCAVNLLRLIDTPANVLRVERSHGPDPAT